MKTKTLGQLVALIVATFGLTALAAFTPPTPTQVAAAAADPQANMAALLKDASAGQAAEVVKAVIAKVLTLGLSSENEKARVAAVVGSAFAAIPTQAHAEFAGALGRAIAGSAAICGTVGVVSTVQSSIAGVSVEVGPSLASVFGVAFAGAPGRGPRTDAPPQSLVYAGQSL